MPYDKQKIFEQAKEAVLKNNLFFISDIVAFVPCSTSTFYEFFPEGSEQSETLKEILNDNKVKTKSAIRSKLFKGSKAAELLSLYRLICTNEERQMLNQQYIDMTTKGKEINIKPITWIGDENKPEI